jgi:exodeoxyribonuclease V alpha subunit
MAAACLQQIFATPTQASGRVNWQQLAVARALTSRLTIISGGPGTGKTTTVANLLACLLAGGADLRVALAAPTGKAAVRMEEALRQRAESLPPIVRARLPTDSYTLHRLLGFNPASGRFRHDAGNPLPFDVVVVDEASMIDLALAARLLDAIGKDTRLVLLGDRDQLAAVENGIVLGDIAADAGMTPAAVATLAPLLQCEPDTLLAQLPTTDTPSPLRGHVILLQENYRFGADSGIGRLATGIREGATDTVVKILTEAASADLAMIDDSAPELDVAQLDRLAGGYDAYLAVVASGGSAEAVFAAFGEYRVLTALREGSRGASGISRLIGQRLCRQSGASPLLGSSDEWWPGRAVIILENDYGVGLFNGDIGIALTLADPSGDKLLVCSPGRDGTIRRIAPTRLPRHTDAWAMTVHKAQGSEFACVDIVLPAAQSAVLTRELLYTAVTRAREHVCLIGSATRLIEGIGNPTQRNGGLLASLRRLAERDGAQPL